MNIFNLALIQVAIAVLISWALFAIFIGLIQEAVAQVLAERGRFMKSYLLKQLQDESNGINWGSLVYLHGAVDLLTRETNKPTNDIHPRLFAEVLIDVIGNAQIVQIKKQPNDYKTLPLSNFKSAMSTLGHSDIVAFLRLALSNAEQKKQNIDGLLNEAIIYEHLVIQLENWYKQFVERLTLWYKKRVRKKLFVFGLIVSTLINVDSIQLFNYFKADPDSRTAVAKYYSNYLAGANVPGTELDYPLISTNATEVTYNLNSLVQEIDLPVGFDYNLFVSQPSEEGWLFWKIVGLLITAFAASFGAPFWFDFLRRATQKKIPF